MRKIYSKIYGVMSLGEFTKTQFDRGLFSGAESTRGNSLDIVTA